MFFLIPVKEFALYLSLNVKIKKDLNYKIVKLFL